MQRNIFFNTFFVNQCAKLYVIMLFILYVKSKIIQPCL